MWISSSLLDLQIPSIGGGTTTDDLHLSQFQLQMAQKPWFNFVSTEYLLEGTSFHIEKSPPKDILNGGLPFCMGLLNVKQNYL